MPYPILKYKDQYPDVRKTLYLDTTIEMSETNLKCCFYSVGLMPD